MMGTQRESIERAERGGDGEAEWLDTAFFRGNAARTEYCRPLSPKEQAEFIHEANGQGEAGAMMTVVALMPLYQSLARVQVPRLPGNAIPPSTSRENEVLARGLMAGLIVREGGARMSQMVAAAKRGFENAN